MPTKDDIAWFKQQFGKAIGQQVENTPFTLDMLTAIACQETGYLWCRLRKRNLPLDRIVELCVGDTITNRSAFPRAKGELLAWPRGKEMFRIARESLVDLAQYLKDFEAPARNPDKFCHGFGIFQYDIQFFKTNPSYFLERKWRDLDQCIARCVGELKAKMARAGVAGKTSLTDQEDGSGRHRL